jgi:opacity protein-like surface antigen
MRTTVHYSAASDPGLPISGDGKYSSTRLNYSAGLDADLIGGFDLGLIRLEAELGYKRAKIDHITFDPNLVFDLTSIQLGNTFDLRHASTANVLSAMLNGLVDIGPSRGISAYFGGGVGVAQTRLLGDSHSGLAWQLIAGARAPISENIDVGVKYRYFGTSRANFHDDFVVGDTIIPASFRGGLRSHSVLASLVYYLGGVGDAPPLPTPLRPPPPPPPPVPATQTCANGSIILATDVCPLPPPPPAPPSGAGERGT